MAFSFWGKRHFVLIIVKKGFKIITFIPNNYVYKKKTFNVFLYIQKQLFNLFYIL